MKNILFSLCFLSLNSIAANYPPNIDYGSEGDFIIKAGTEFGRTADLMMVGPVLINLPEAPGSTDVGVVYRGEDTAWDLSDLTNPTLIRSLTCDTCFLSQPTNAHATMIRFIDNEAMLYTPSGFRPSNVIFDPTGNDSNAQVVLADHIDPTWDFDPLNYSSQTSPYYVRMYWEYDVEDEQFGIRDPSQILSFDEPSFWLGEFLVQWDHLGQTGVTGFATWLGNLLVIASDQQSTGLAIYDTSGFKQGQTPQLLSIFRPTLTEPDGHSTSIGGYWMEPYGTTKMVWAARIKESSPSRNYPAFYVVDFENPLNPQLTCEIYFNQDPLDPSDGDEHSNPMYVNFQDQYAYVDHFRVDIDGCETAYSDGNINTSEFEEIVYKFNDMANNCDASQYFRPLGQVGIFGGIDTFETESINEQGMCFFVTSDEPDLTPPFVSGHRPLANQTNYPVDGFVHIHIPETLRSETVLNAVEFDQLDSDGLVVGNVAFKHQLSHTGTLSIWPDNDLNANTTYQVRVSGIQDYMGNTMLPYSFSFSTGEQISGDPTPTPEPTPQPSSTPTPQPTGTPTPDVPSFSGTPYFANQSSQIACEPELENGQVWVVNPDNDSVTIIRRQLTSTNLNLETELIGEISLNYEHPTSVAKVGELFAITYRDDDKVVFHNEQGYPIYAIDTGHGTQPVASVYDGEFLYVALYGSGELIKINPTEPEIIARLAIGPYPKAMALHNNRLLITRFISTHENGYVYDVDTTGQMNLTNTILLNKITVADELMHGSGVPNYLSSIVISSDATLAYVTANKANIDRGSFRNGLSLDDDNTVRPMMAIIDLVNNRDANTEPNTTENTIDFDNAADPAGTTFLVDGNIRATSFQGNNAITLDDLDQDRSALVPVGGGPQNMCATTRTLWVKNFTTRTVSAIDVSGFMFDGRQNPSVQTINTVSSESLSEDELLGLQVFYHARQEDISPEGYIACATCHSEGGHDGMVWDITNLGEGLRNTIDLRGSSGTRFGDLHWSSNFDEVQDFEIQIEQLNRGTGLIPGLTFTDQSPLEQTTSGQSEELDALATYVSSLGQASVKRSPYREYTGELTIAAMNGLDIFIEQGCDSCHAGSAYRDGQNHDVGTLTLASGSRLGETISAIRTPSLIQLWDSAPYFHDGSAASLQEVLTIGEHAIDVSNEDRDDLIQYLLSIDRELFISDAEIFNPVN